MTGAAPRERSCDAIVIGAGIGGLTAAAYLARAGRRVCVFERHGSLGGRVENVALGGGIAVPMMEHAVCALDDRMLRDLDLSRHGLRQREAAPLVGLHAGGRHLVIPANGNGSRDVLAEDFATDARALAAYRRELASAARLLAPWWTPESIAAEPAVAGSFDAMVSRLQLAAKDARRIETFFRRSANAYLDSWFAGDSLKTLLAADACLHGLSPQESGSALALLWRASQAGAAARGIQGGPTRLGEALAAAAREKGATLCLDAGVAEILVEKRRMTGVRLESGAVVRAPVVLSSLGRHATFSGLVPVAALPVDTSIAAATVSRIATGKALLVLDSLPPFAGLPPEGLEGRLLVAPRPESVAEAKAAALLGAIPDALVLEIAVPTAANGTQSQARHHVVSVRIPYLPAQPARAWTGERDRLKKHVVAVLERYAPGITGAIVASAVFTPADIAARYGEGDNPASLMRLVSSYASRIRTPVQGLYLCGRAAEPADAISGRAGRLAAGLAHLDLQLGAAA